MLLNKYFLKIASLHERLMEVEEVHIFYINLS